MPCKPPKGFEDPLKRQAAADKIADMINAFEGDAEKVRKFARYGLAKDVKDDKITMTSLEFIEDIEPYQIPLLRTLGETIVGDVAKAFTGTDPYYVYRKSVAGVDDVLRENREHDMQLALEADSFNEKIRDLADNSFTHAIAPFRARWEEIKKGEGWMGESEMGNEYAFAGPTWELILPADIRLYPLNQKDPNKLRLTCHQIRPMVWEMREKQKAEDGYFDDIEIGVSNHEGEHSVPFEEDYVPDTFAGNVKLPEGMDESKPLRAYRFEMVRDTRQLLSLSEYDDFENDYFLPMLAKEPGVILPEHSVASKCLEPQTLYNDCYTAQVLGAVSSARPTVLGSGLAGDMDTMNVGMDRIVFFRGNPEFTVIPSQFRSGADLNQVAQDMARVAEGVTKTSQTGAGQLPDPDQTATATAGALQGEAESTMDYQERFLNGEIARAVRFNDYLIGKHFQSFKKCHGDRLKTTKASDWKPKYEVAPNGLGASNNPAVALAKIDKFLETCSTLGIQVRKDEMLALDAQQVISAVIQYLDLGIQLEKAIIEVNPEDQAVPPVEDGAYGGGAFGVDPAVLEQALADPEFLAGVLGAIPPGIPPEMGGFAGGPPPFPDPGMLVAGPDSGGIL